MNKQERLERDNWNNVEPVLFYSPANNFGELSNFSFHPILLPNPWTLELQEYASGEHRYQALKGDNEADHDYVLEVSNPGAAQKRGQQVSLREGWREDNLGLGYYVMLELVTAKAIQHEDVSDVLASTQSRLIYEDSPTDDIWGWRHANNYGGNNLLGLCWMQTRDLLL